MNWQNIETERLLLKGIDETDTDFIFEHFRDDYVCKYLFDAEPFAEVAEARGMIRAFANEKNESINRWVIREKSGGARLGTCGFLFWDKENKSAEIGCDLRQEACGKGFMTEALRAVFDLAYSEKGINRIQANTYIDNAACCTLLERLGFKREGIARDKHFFRGSYYDHYCYSLLKREWRGSALG